MHALSSNYYCYPVDDLICDDLKICHNIRNYSIKLSENIYRHS